MLKQNIMKRGLRPRLITSPGGFRVKTNLFLPNYIFHCFFHPKLIFHAFLQIIPPKLHFSLFFQYKIEFSCFFHFFKFFSIFRYYISKSRWDPIPRAVVPHPKPSICRTSGHVVIFSDPQNAHFAYIVTKNEKK